MSRKVSEIVSSRIGNAITNVNTWGGVMKNVASFGAVGDGVTDDTAAVQAAIDAAIADGGKAVFFPNGSTGVYKVTSLSSLASVVLFGDNASFSGISNVIHQLGEVGTNEIITAMIIDGAVTNDKLATDVKVGSLAALTTTDKTSMVAATNEHLASTTPHATVQGVNKLGLTAATALTISAGAITVTQSFHAVDTEAAAATDDLVTINGGAVGDILYLRGVSAARVPTIRNGLGNIFTYDNTDVTIPSSGSVLALISLGATWQVVGIQGVKRSGDTMLGNSELLIFKKTISELGNIFIRFRDSGNGLMGYFGYGSLTNNLDVLNHISGGDIRLLTTGSGKVLINTVPVITGLGSPEGVTTAIVGSLFLRKDGGAATTLYVKESGVGNTGWIAK